MDTSRDGRPIRRALALVVAVFSAMCVAVVVSPLPSEAHEVGPTGVRTAVSVAAPGLADLRAPGRLERAPIPVAIRRRARTRGRCDEALGAELRGPLAPALRGPARCLPGSETLRVLRLRALAVLSWCASHRGARWGLLHAHGAACPPPTAA